MNVTPENLRNLYLQAIQGSTLPVMLCHIGEGGKTPLPISVLKSLLLEEKVVATILFVSFATVAAWLRETVQLSFN